MILGPSHHLVVDTSDLVEMLDVPVGRATRGCPRLEVAAMCLFVIDRDDERNDGRLELVRGIVRPGNEMDALDDGIGSLHQRTP